MIDEVYSKKCVPNVLKMILLSAQIPLAFLLCDFLGKRHLDRPFFIFLYRIYIIHVDVYRLEQGPTKFEIQPRNRPGPGFPGSGQAEKPGAARKETPETGPKLGNPRRVDSSRNFNNFYHNTGNRKPTFAESKLTSKS